MSINYNQYQGKKVTLVRSEPGKTDTEEIEGLVEVSNETGILIKPKGKAQLVLIEISEIESIDFVDEKPKDLTAKTLKIVEFGQSRNHLLERHGYTLAQVNGLTEKEGFEFHSTLNHTELNLGHIHGDKEVTDRAVAVEAVVAS